MIVLVIMDGFGISQEDHGNAILHAKKPFYDWATQNFPFRTLFAHGRYVGLPGEQMGNSEVGHLNIGGGRRIRPDLDIINTQIGNGAFFENSVLLGLIETVKARSGRLHVMGLLSDGGIHSHINHLRALLNLIAENGAVTTFLHAFLDGRDTAKKIADRFVNLIQKVLDSHRNQYFRSLAGRSWGMDRDRNWLREQANYDAIVRGVASYRFSSAIEAVEAAFERGETDEMVSPTVIEMPGGVDGRVLDGDGVIHFNFRADRAVQMTRALTEKGFSEFDVSDRPEIDMVTFTRYDDYLDTGVAFEGEVLHDTLTEVLSRNGRKVFKIAETEKWAHVTRFFNGGIFDPFPGEERELVQSPQDVRPFYDRKPEMSALKIAERLEQRIALKSDDLIVVNFANPDMVGHTGNFEATVKAIETVDECLKRVYEAASKVGATVIITADHGNAERKIDENGDPATKHTLSPVPFILLDKSIRLRQDEGELADIAPTILEMMGLEKPEAMTGRSLIAKEES